MIRLRIERKTIDFTPENDGLCWYEKGQIVGRMIIEQQQEYADITGDGELCKVKRWVPVEVIYE